MDLEKVLAQLRAELENVDAAILSLERLQQATSKRRGRPPLWLSGDHDDNSSRPRRRKPRRSDEGKNPD
jgi:hypothetical protein